MLGENLGIATLSGYDEYSKNTYTKNGTLYTIKNISKECAIAIQLDGTNEYYSYVNSYYRPETLGEFIEDLNLKEIISFGSIWYDDVYTDEEGNTHYDNIEFPEHMVLSFNDEETSTIYFTQFADYSRIYRAVWEIFDNYEDTNKRDELYNKFINMSITINAIMYEGKELDEMHDDIIVPVFELNADERFEVR